MALRLVQPEYTVATSDGIRNGTREMRYSLIGREVTQDSLNEHLSATGLAGTIVDGEGLAGYLRRHNPALDPGRGARR